MGLPTGPGTTGSNLPQVPGVGETGPTAAINVTPMIDVMLVLLIIFMVVTPVLFQYEATPPAAVTAREAGGEDVVTVGIDVEGSFYLDDRRVELESLRSSLREAYSGANGDGLMYLRADRGVSYALVLDALEVARAAGVSRVGAVTRPVEDVDSDPSEGGS